METMTSADPEILESNQNHEFPNNSNDMELSNSDPSTQTKMIDVKTDNASPNGVSDGQSEDGKEQSDSMIVDETIAVAPLVNPEIEEAAPVGAVPLALIPAMKGKLTVENNLVLCKGVWAMSEASLTVPEQTSNFEFKLVRADEGCHSFPYTGKYQGWFHLKPPPPTKNPIKIDERDIRIEFTTVEDSNSEFTVVGRGTNKFGKYNLKGKLDGTGEILLYREYEPKVISVGPRKRNSTGEIKTNLARSSSDASMVESVISPREGGRIRKQSSVMKEYEESQVKPFSPRAVSNNSIAEKGKKDKQFERSTKIQKVETVSTSLVTASGRSQRMPLTMQKCSDLLKEMSKNRFAIWFLEPVDWVKLNLPDYPRIIKTPMDFKTIGEKLEKREYESPDLFAEDMRLVFRNAILFNQLQNDPVHMAARELAKKFEDRYRQVSALFTSDSITYTEAFALEKTTKLKSKKSKPQAMPVPTPRGRGAKAFPAGPRPVHYLPPAVDGSSHQLLEMQKIMQTMQQEIQALRSAVKEKEIEKKVDTKLKNSDSIPLSYEEKKRLIGQINLLPPEPMQGVIDIVREAPGAGDQDEILIDELDNGTQRKLQVFVHNYFHQKKKAPKRASGPKPDGPKRLRKPKANSNSGYTTYNAPVPSSNLADAIVEDDELLFGFEELRSGAQKTGNESDASDIDEDDAFDQKQSQSTAAKGQPKSDFDDDVDDDFGDMVENPLQINSDLQIGNADSWTTSHFDDTSSNNVGESSASWNDAAESFKQNKMLEEITKAESEKLLQQRLNAEVARANPNQ